MFDCGEWNVVLVIIAFLILIAIACYGGLLGLFAVLFLFIVAMEIINKWLGRGC